ncbi:N-acetyltransferase [Jeongeupia sp. HS-3]|uniref:GNAT family N-acetyltransferase n=1 Tax=Jeongeupia sp. HS-3 TaxID=1009682 RepID=UPI0018A66675|nr:GNAT family N-acetyltransferase [Jeongeupia sp. HS-3]BCL75454.1 N-acetyltransferase [Jeongeupia sp. HS-3]
MPTPIHLSLLTPAMLDHVLAIQSACYPQHYNETREVFARKLALCADSHWLAWQGSEPVGYFFTHPWHGDTPPMLGHELTALPASADCHYLHDLAILPTARGLGVAQTLVGAALDWGRAQHFSRTLLVAVQGSAPFWARYGFAPLGPAEGYGEGATLMRRNA